ELELPLRREPSLAAHLARQRTDGEPVPARAGDRAGPRSRLPDRQGCRQDEGAARVPLPDHDVLLSPRAQAPDDAPPTRAAPRGPRGARGTRRASARLPDVHDPCGAASPAGEDGPRMPHLRLAPRSAGTG